MISAKSSNVLRPKIIPRMRPGKVGKVSMNHYLVQNALSTRMSLGVSREKLDERAKAEMEAVL